MAVVEYSKEGTFLSDKENIAKITLNRPEVMNAISYELMQELNQALDKAEADPDIRAVIITGSGKAFCAGLDLKGSQQLSLEEQENFTNLGQNVFKRIEEFPKAVIAAINGFAFGGGMELALACDIRVATDESKMGLTEASLGLIPAWGGLQRLPPLIGMSRSKEMILTANMYSTKELYEFGLLNKIVPLDEVASTAAFLAAKIADNAPLAVKFSKASLNGQRSLSPEEAYAKDSEYATILKGSKDFEEGVTAFLGKRKPVYKGE